MGIQYENRLVAFIDILGFSSLIKESEKDVEKLDKICKTLIYLKTHEAPSGWNLRNIEIEEDAQRKGVENFRIADKIQCTCFSDSIIVSVNLENIEMNEAVSSLVANLAFIGAYLLAEGILIRGGMTYGNLIHSDKGIVLGQALLDAYKTENDIARCPRILLSTKLLNELNYPLDMKRNRYPYHQYLNRFEDGCVGFHQLIFFQVVPSWVEMGEDVLANKLLKAKKTIINGLDENFDSPYIFTKYKWLKEQYQKLYIDQKIKEPIYELNEGISGNNIHYSSTDNFYFKR